MTSIEHALAWLSVISVVIAGGWTSIAAVARAFRTTAKDMEHHW